MAMTASATGCAGRRLHQLTSGSDASIASTKVPIASTRPACSAVVRCMAGATTSSRLEYIQGCREGCGACAWAEAATPLARPDRVHLSVEGYAQSADGFYEALMRAYRDFRTGRTGS